MQVQINQTSIWISDNELYIICELSQKQINPTSIPLLDIERAIYDLWPIEKENNWSSTWIQNIEQAIYDLWAIEKVN